MTEDPIISKPVWFLYTRELHQLKVNVIELLSKNATLDVQMNRKPTGFSEKKLEKTFKITWELLQNAKYSISSYSVRI